ncbi:MAG: T9SS type A sorting domain-containing protein, partial [Chitinophagaceae bacterium]
ISAPYELKVYRIPGASCSNSTTAGGLYYRTANYGFLTGTGSASTPIGYYVDMITPNFSGFFLQDVAENVLPATCGSFTYKTNNDGIEFSLHTLTENNVLHFELQQSSNGSNFSTTQLIQAKNQQNSIYKANINWQQISNKAFFRIKQVDKDGSISYLCNTLQINKSTAKNLFAAIYPNPVNKQLVLQAKAAINGNVTINLYQSNGLLIQQFRNYFTTAQNSITIPVATLSKGSYFLQIITNNGNETQHFMKQ